MIVGNGMIARAFHAYADNDGVVIFASGVSNSGEKDPQQFLREKNRLADELTRSSKRLFVYFSTCSIDDLDVSSSPYVLHKGEMEQMIKAQLDRYLIFRLPQVVGSSPNRTTLVNFLCDKISRGERFTVWKHAVRYLIDVEDVVAVSRLFIEDPTRYNSTINIALHRYAVMDIVSVLEQVCGKKASYELVDKGTPYSIDTSDIAVMCGTAGARSAGEYLDHMLRKYYTGAGVPDRQGLRES